MAEPSLRTLLRPFQAPCLLPRRKRTLWTHPYMVAPAYVRAKFGNGKRLICLLPIMHRPKYYLVWIDDRWDLQNGDEWLDQLDRVWEEIGNEFGYRLPEDAKPYRWPEEDSSGGCCWEDADSDDVLPKRMRRRYVAAICHKGTNSP